MGVKVAAILAGGYGKRLKPLTEEKPKPLLRIAGKSILEWQIRWLKKNGVEEIVVLAGYKGEQIRDELGKGDALGVNLEYSFERTPLGTGGALKNAEELLSKHELFYVLNGDVLTNLDPTRMEGELQEETMGVLAAVPLPSPYGILDINNGIIRGFIEKPLIKGVWISAGVYLLRKEILSYLPSKGDIEKTAFPQLAKQGKLKAKKYENVFWKSIDSHKDLEEADRLLREKPIT